MAAINLAARLKRAKHPGNLSAASNFSRNAALLYQTSKVARLLATGIPFTTPRMQASGLRRARHFDGAAVGAVGATFGAKNWEYTNVAATAMAAIT